MRSVTKRANASPSGSAATAKVAWIPQSSAGRICCWARKYIDRYMNGGGEQADKQAAGHGGGRGGDVGEIAELEP